MLKPHARKVKFERQTLKQAPLHWTIRYQLNKDVTMGTQDTDTLVPLPPDQEGTRVGKSG